MLAQELAIANGVDDVVRVIQGNVSEVEPPERVDVIVSEWLGGFGIDEGMLVPVITARDRWLKPAGIDASANRSRRGPRWCTTAILRT